VNPTATTRKSAEERREDVLEAAREVFAEHGLSGASTDEIARRAGISQPYLFRLFRTKKELFLATVERCHSETRETFERAAEGKTGEQALKAMGQAYRELIRSNPNRLRAQMQTFAACEDPDVRRVARRGFGELVAVVERASGADAETVSRFFAKGMLINAVVSMGLQDSDSGWARTLMSFVALDEA
jgi:AcrR family transcriptional regulator